MATKLGRRVRREVASVGHGPLIVTLEAEGMYLREKGRRTAFLLPYGAAYLRAAMLADARRRADKAAERKAKGGQGRKVRRAGVRDYFEHVARGGSR